jgi:peptidyl-prolyl cis-trans isomerase D
MLQVLRRGQRWVLWLVIVALAAGMVFFLAVGSGSWFGQPAHVAVAVGSRQFDFRDFDRVRQQQIDEFRRTLGDAFDPQSAGEYLDQMAANSLVQVAILAQEGERLGLRVGEQEMRAFLRTVPGGTGSDGRLDRQAWTDHAEREYGSVARFEAALRDDLLARKTAALIEESLALSDAEVRDVLRHGLEEVELAYVAVDPASLRAKQEVSDAEVEALLASDLPRVQRHYDERRSEFDQPEQIRARHVLVRIPSGPDPDPAKAEAEARARIEQAAARIRGGEPFEKVAADVSEDPGSKATGGDLGFFPRGRMVPAFEEAAFGLEVGKVSEPVRSSYGFHLIRVEEKRPAKLVAFEEVRSALARELLLEEKAGQAADALVAKVVEAIRGGKSLVDAARERGLAIERPEPLRRRPDGAIPGLGSSKEAVTAAFLLSDEKPTSDRVFQIDGKRVLLQRLGGKRPSDDELAVQLPRAREQLLGELRRSLEAAWIEARRSELEKAGELVYNLAPAREAQE